MLCKELFEAEVSYIDGKKVYLNGPEGFKEAECPLIRLVF